MEILGYTVRREIGRGGSSHVYLAEQQATGALVAVKMMTAGDAECWPRFLRAAEIAKGLRHPNIVRVYDAAASGEALYLVTDYVPGGDLNDRLRSGLPLPEALTIIKDIAAALDYAHGEGVVHGDVKPENILIDDQGTASLTDFGIAAATADAAPDGALASRSPAGPEPLAGAAGGARSDFYALGVVFHRILTGRPPVGRPAGSGTPNLPLQLAPFQDVMRRFLASSPEERFRSGAEIAAALDAVQSAGAAPNAVFRTETVTTAEIDAVADAWLGPDGAEAAATRRWPLPALPTAVIGTFLVLAAVAGIGYLASPPGTTARALAFTGWVEHPDTASAWREAEALRRDPNQGLGAVVAAYRRVLARDAGHPGAAAAIAAVAAQWQRDIGAALDAGDTALAGAKLDELADIFPEDPALPSFFDQLRDRRQAQRLLADTKRLLGRSGLSHVPSVDSAIVRYKEVLRLVPEHPEALQALTEIAVFHGDAAQRQAAAGDLALAMESFGRAFAANETFPGVAAVNDTISEAQGLQARIDAMLQQAADFRAAGALIDPVGANAAEIYRQVLATRPDDAVANQGLAGISTQVLSNFDAVLQADRLEDASRLLDRAAASGIGDDLVMEMRARYEAELERIEAVKTLIGQAEALYEEGYITGPDRAANAVARLREALRLDADNADGARLLFMCATRLATVAQQAYDAGMAEEGLHYLDLALTVTPGISRWREWREIWQTEIEGMRGTSYVLDQQRAERQATSL